MSSEKRKNAKHRLFDTLITALSIEQRYFVARAEAEAETDALLTVRDLVSLLRTTTRCLCVHRADAQIFKGGRACETLRRHGGVLVLSVTVKSSDWVQCPMSVRFVSARGAGNTKLLTV